MFRKLLAWFLQVRIYSIFLKAKAPRSLWYYARAAAAQQFVSSKLLQQALRSQIFARMCLNNGGTRCKSCGGGASLRIIYVGGNPSRVNWIFALYKYHSWGQSKSFNLSHSSTEQAKTKLISKCTSWWVNQRIWVRKEHFPVIWSVFDYNVIVKVIIWIFLILFVFLHSWPSHFSSPPSLPDIWAHHLRIATVMPLHCRTLMLPPHCPMLMPPHWPLMLMPPPHTATDTATAMPPHCLMLMLLQPSTIRHQLLSQLPLQFTMLLQLLLSTSCQPPPHTPIPTR